MNIITKQPRDYNLARKHISLYGSEISEMMDFDNPAEIQVFDQDDNLQYVISQDQFKNMSFYAKQGFTGAYFVASFENCILTSEPKRATRVYKIPAKRASNSDPKFSFTYRTNDLKKTGINIDPIDGELYQFEYSNGSIVTMKASRNGSTLYSRKLDGNYGLPIPNQCGVVKTHTIVGIKHV